MKKGKFKAGLFVKIFAVCLVCILVPMLVNLMNTTYSASNALETESSMSLSRIVAEKNHQVDLLFNSQFDIMDAWVNELFVVDFFKELAAANTVNEEKRVQIEEMLKKRHANANGLYENIFFTYNDHVLVDGIGGQSVGYRMDEELEYYYYEQLKNPGEATGKYMYSPITGRPTLPIVNSIVDDATKEVLSVFVIPLDVNKLTESLVERDAGQNIGTMILDPSGLVIASDQPELALQLNFNEQDEVKAFFEGMKMNLAGIGKFTLNGTENIAAYVQHETHGFYILSYMSVAQYMEKVDGLRTGIITVILASVVLMGVAVFLVVGSLVKPIKELVAAAKKIAQGDLTVEQIRIKNKDEIGELGQSFNIMLASLKEIVERLRLTSEKVAVTAEEFSATAKQSSEISKQVAETVRQVAAGTEDQSRHTSFGSEKVKEIAVKVGHASENMQSVASAADITSEKANVGAQTVYTSISEIEQINENVVRMAEKVSHFDERSKEIGQIVEVISQIAEQTNLLALNASIEAARAGEHGQGFAVVASEVRKLADQSKQSTAHIKQLIDDILKETNETVHSMNAAAAQSAKGIAAIQTVELTFNEIHRSVNEVSGQIQEATSAAMQISEALHEITANIDEISRISRETAGQTQEVSAAIEEQFSTARDISASASSMAELAEELQGLVHKFKVSGSS